MAVLVHRILHRGPVSHWLLSYLPEINFLGLAAAGTAPKYAFHTKINAQILSSMITFSENPEVVLRAKAFGKTMAQKIACRVQWNTLKDSWHDRRDLILSFPDFGR